MYDLSICIVNWNGAHLLEPCLRSIFEQPSQTSFEVIVVDNGSTDDSLAMLQREFSQVKVRVNQENVGFTRANNQAFQIAQGRYLLMLNNDTLVKPGALTHLVAFMDDHPEAGIVGCRLLNPDGSLQPSCWPFPTVRSMLFRALYLDKLFPRSHWAGAYYAAWEHDAVREVDVVMGCCLLVRRQVLDQVGPLDEGFFIYWEETDWCRRAKQQGWQVLFTPQAEVVHFGGQTTRSHSATMRLIYHQSRQRYFRKHHGRLVGAQVRLLSIIETGLRLTYWSSRSLLRPHRPGSAAMIGVYWPALRWLLTGYAPGRP